MEIVISVIGAIALLCWIVSIVAAFSCLHYIVLKSFYPWAKMPEKKITTQKLDGLKNG